MKITPEKIAALLKRHGSLKNIARLSGRSYAFVQKQYTAAVEQGLIEHVKMGRKPHADQKPVSIQRVKALKTKKARHKAYILTCAQNNTLIHESTWGSLKALAAHYDAQILVSTFLYSRRSAWQGSLDKKPGGREDTVWYDPQVVPYINNDRVEIAKGLVWCGELNISPTAERPLSGLEVYTGRASMIVPHVKLALDSIATVGGKGTKLNYTTGTVTLRNYIQRKAGFKAEFHHCYGALIVEVDEFGHWWVRQLNADSDGTIHDLDVKVEGGKVTTGNRVEAITFGDVHVANMDDGVSTATWGKGGMVDALRPRFQFIHDVLDFYSRSHHAMKNPLKMYKRYVERKDNVAVEVENVGRFLDWSRRKDCQTVIVDSNHDRHLGRWLAENDGRRDPVNAYFWSTLNHAVYQYIAENRREPNYLELALAYNADNVAFLDADTSFVICPEHGGGIECGMHGDQGPNGARGSIRSFARMGRRSNVGHRHACGIDGGAYQTGTKSKLRLEYNGGPSNWTHSDIVTHENGKRQIVTFYAGKWRA